jgi:hypothetical protein
VPAATPHSVSGLEECLLLVTVAEPAPAQ